MRHFRIKDKFRTSDKCVHGLRGELIFGTGRHLVEYTDPFGNVCQRTEFDKILYHDTNTVLIGGYQYVFNKLFNIGLDKESTLRVGDLNDEAPQMKIGVPRAEYKSIYYNAETSLDANNPQSINPGINIPGRNFIFGFMVGDGGTREDNNGIVIAPDYKRRSLFRPIPFRMSNDGYDIPEGKYFGKSTSFQNTSGDTINSYYIKTFDEPAPRIIHQWVTDNPNEVSIVDDSVFSSTSSTPIESYVEMNITISGQDCRGFFTSSNTIPRVNEFGLVAGWYNSDKNDYECIRLITHFTRPSIMLTEQDSVEAKYLLYAR